MFFKCFTTSVALILVMLPLFDFLPNPKPIYFPDIVITHIDAFYDDDCHEDFDVSMVEELEMI